MSDKKLSITLMKSKYCRLVNHQNCILGLGLKKIRQTRVVDDTPEIRGMVNKVSYLLKVEEVH